MPEKSEVYLLFFLILYFTKKINKIGKERLIYILINK